MDSIQTNSREIAEFNDSSRMNALIEFFNKPAQYSNGFLYQFVNQDTGNMWSHEPNHLLVMNLDEGQVYSLIPCLGRFSSYLHYLRGVTEFVPIKSRTLGRHSGLVLALNRGHILLDGQEWSQAIFRVELDLDYREYCLIDVLCKFNLDSLTAIQLCAENEAFFFAHDVLLRGDDENLGPSSIVFEIVSSLSSPQEFKIVERCRFKVTYAQNTHIVGQNVIRIFQNALEVYSMEKETMIMECSMPENLLFVGGITNAFDSGDKLFFTQPHTVNLYLNVVCLGTQQESIIRVSQRFQLDYKWLGICDNESLMIFGNKGHPKHEIRLLPLGRPAKLLVMTETRARQLTKEKSTISYQIDQ